MSTTKEEVRQAVREEMEERERRELLSQLCQLYGSRSYDHFKLMSLEGLRARVRRDASAGHISGVY